MYFIIMIMVLAGTLAPLPQAIRSIQRGCSKGVSKWLIILWALDKSSSLVYSINIGDVPLMTKYSISLVFIMIIAWYKRID